MSQLGDRIQMAQRQTEHFELLDDQMISNLASIYLDVVSPIGPRIQVTGTPSVLQQTSNQHKVRACCYRVFAAQYLWRQVGGKRRHLIFRTQEDGRASTNPTCSNVIRYQVSSSRLSRAHFFRPKQILTQTFAQYS